MSTETPKSAAVILREAADLIEPPRSWTQGALGRTSPNGEPEFHLASAKCFCAAGAIALASGIKAWNGWELRGEADAMAFLATSLAGRPLAGQRAINHIEDWNDDAARTKRQVVAALRKAADLAEAGE